MLLYRFLSCLQGSFPGNRVKGSDEFHGDFLQELFLQGAGDAPDYGPADFKFNGEAGVLVGNVDPGANDEMNLITVEQHPDNLVGRTVRKFEFWGVILEDFSYLA